MSATDVGAETKRPDSADLDPMDVLPLSVGFAVEYLDGVMVGEQREIRQQWKTVRTHLLEQAASKAG